MESRNLLKIFWAFLVYVFITGCEEKPLQGVYICQGEQQQHITIDSLKLGTFNCIVRKMEFKGLQTVIVSFPLVMGGDLTTTYTMSGNKIRIKTNGADLIVKRKSANNLEGEGLAKGIYRKE